MLFTFQFISKSSHFFASQSCHHRNARHIRRSSPNTVFCRSNIDKCGLRYFRKFTKTDSVAKEDFGYRSKDDEECIKYLFLNFVLHAR